MSLRKVVFSLLTLSLTISCVPKETNNTSTASYNRLVDDYNALAEKYNNQTDRNVEGDKIVQEVALDLKALDNAVNAHKDLLSKAYRQISAKQCSEAQALISRELKKNLEVVTDKANTLVQGSMMKGLEHIKRDLSPYKMDSKLDAFALANTVAEQISPGLTGIKSFVLEAHNQLVEKFNESCAKDRAASVPTPTTPVGKDSVVTVDKSGSREVITRDALKSKYAGTYSEQAYNYYSDLAIGSGGFLGFSPKAEMLPDVVDAVFSDILNKAGKMTDVAIVLDTTSSMSDDIGNVKVNMQKLITKLKSKASSIGLKLSLVLYRDKGDAYVTKVAMNFTESLDLIDAAIQDVVVEGGGDEPEAVIDALATALKDLSWRPGASRSVVLIGDAPGHPIGINGMSQAAILDAYKREGLGIIVYPILVNK